MNLVISFVLDLFFPNRCPCCDRFIDFKNLICDKCKAQLTLTDYCPKCANARCICQTDNPQCERSFVFFDYENAAKRGIISYKSGENLNFLHYMGNCIYSRLKSEKIYADYVCYAPMTRKSYILRRFNHSKVLAKYAAKATNAKLLSAFTLDKSAQTQHLLSAKMRRENCRNIRMKNLDLSGKTVIFCDDITTTGSTMLRAVSLLKSAGAKNVICVFGAKSNLNER